MVFGSKKEDTGRFPSAKEFENQASSLWNGKPVLREEPHCKVVHLAIAMAHVRPWNQKYDSYHTDVLKTLQEMYDGELTRVREALLRRTE